MPIRRRWITVSLLLAMGHPSIRAQPAPASTLADPAGSWRAEVEPQGLRFVEFRHSNGWQRAAFHTNAAAGPAWQIFADGAWQTIALQQPRATEAAYTGDRGPLRFGLRFEPLGSRLAVQATLQNIGSNAVGPLQAGLRLGLGRPFTVLRCEPTHAWGLAALPEGGWIGLSAPDRIVGWQHDGSDIRLELLDPPPASAQPAQEAPSLQAGALRVWTFILELVPARAGVGPQLSASARAPMLEVDPLTAGPRGITAVRVYSSSPVAGQLSGPDGTVLPLRFNGVAAGVWSANVELAGPPGAYPLLVRDARGRTAEALLHVRRPWSAYLQQARARLVARAPTTAPTDALELAAAFCARRLFPDPVQDAAVEAQFQAMRAQLSDPAAGARLFTAHYRASGDPSDLDAAATYCEALLARPDTVNTLRPGDDATRGIGKAVLDVMAEERRLGRTDAAWRARFERHDAAVRQRLATQAAREPAADGGLLSAEGAELALFALWQTNLAERAAYLAAAEARAATDGYASQLRAPDAGAQGADLMAIPAEGSAWRIRTLWYLYRLTGRESYLREAYEALAACLVHLEADEQEADAGGAAILLGLEEVALSVCHVVERPGRVLATYNGSTRMDGEVLVVEPAEPCVSGVHVNLRRPTQVRALLQGKLVEKRIEQSGWLGRAPSL